MLVPLAKELSTQAKVRHIFDSLQSGSLISIGQLCDEDCVALFTKYDANIYKDGKVIIVGECNDTNGLWNIPLAPKPTLRMPQPHHSANGTIKNVRTKRDLTAFLHACAFSPLPSTFLRAIQRGHLLQILARPDHDPAHHQTPSQITSNQQRPSTQHGTAKHSVDQDHHRPRPSNITRHHLLPGAKQPTNKCRLRSHTNRNRTTKITLGPDRQVPCTILAWL